MTIEVQVNELERKLKTDARLGRRYEADRLDALAQGGLPNLALELEQKSGLDRNSRAALQDAGLRAQAVKPSPIAPRPWLRHSSQRKRRAWFPRPRGNIFES